MCVNCFRGTAGEGKDSGEKLRDVCVCELFQRDCR